MITSRQKRALIEGLRDLKRAVNQASTSVQWAAGADSVTDACGVFAAKKCWELFRKDVPCGVLRFNYPPKHRFAGEGHAVCAYKLPDGSVSVYEPGRGSISVGKIGNSASAIAQAFVEGATRACWLTDFE